MAKINLNSSVCKGCETCVKQCPTGVFKMKEGKSMVLESDDCMACRLCETICPMNGIVVKEE